MKFDHASAAIILNEKREYLLQLRDDKNDIFYPNCWGLFGGASIHNESLSDTIMREISEELSLDIRSFKYFTSIQFDLNFMSKGKINRNYYFVQLSYDEEKKIKINEGKDYRFFKEKDLKNLTNLVPYDSYILWLFINFHKKI